MTDRPILAFDRRDAWREWLDGNHASSTGVTLHLAKKDNPAASITHAEALDEALRYGWIDGVSRSADDGWWRKDFLPRGRRSLWSKINRAAAEAMIASGRMTPACLAAVEAARADGRWDRAYAAQAAAGVPDDLQAALDVDPVAAAFFATLGAKNRYAVLHRIETAIRPETRARRITQFVAMLARGETFH